MSRDKISIVRLQKMKQAGEKITSLTAYDASFTVILEQAGVEVLLVGDSLGMVLHGRENTLGVTVGDILYHTRQVTRASERALVIADMPFMSYTTPAQALGNAARLMGEGGARMIKIESGGNDVEIVRHLNRHDVPVCAHIGLKPQSVHKYGGHRVQGRDQAAAERLLADAMALEEAGAVMMVLECIPSELAARITGSVSIPTIGIGAGRDCDGQILVLHDILGISLRSPHLARNFLVGHDNIGDAVREYVEAVKTGSFPGPENSYD